jgi:serine/threonine protein kinase
MQLASGSRIGPYEVLEPIGKGGMGEVYRDRDTAFGRDVALKVLPETFAGDADRLARFELEAQALAYSAIGSCVRSGGSSLIASVRFRLGSVDR